MPQWSASKPPMRTKPTKIYLIKHFHIMVQHLDFWLGVAAFACGAADEVSLTTGGGGRGGGGRGGRGGNGGGGGGKNGGYLS